MTFQAYLDNIKQKTGKTPDDFHTLAKKKGLAGPDVKATQLVKWLGEEFGLGHGHSMAIWAVFKARGWVAGPTKAASTKAKPSAKAAAKAKPTGKKK